MGGKITYKSSHRRKKDLQKINGKRKGEKMKEKNRVGRRTFRKEGGRGRGSWEKKDGEKSDEEE